MSNMTKSKLFSKMEKMLEKHPMIAKSKVLSVNELVYMLRFEDEEYNISLIEKDGNWSCIPSARETFIGTKTLALKIASIDFDVEGCNEEMICMIVHTK
jgi:hypothetical protein